MKARIVPIRQLASRELQERYIVNGTADEYLLPDELVGDALTFVERIESQKIGSSFTPRLRELMVQLGTALKAAEPAVYNDTITNEELVARNPEWAAVRDAAMHFVEA